MPGALLGSTGVGPLGVKFLDEAATRPDGFDPEDDGGGLSLVLMMSLDPC